MKISVTGGAGKLGREVVTQLNAVGHEVRAVDRVQGHGITSGDLRDPAFVAEILAGAEAVVHLAAWPTPHAAPITDVFSDNLRMASNVLYGCVEKGIRRVVVASSQSVLGLPWASSVTEPDYLPVDERHPCRPSDGYSLSKLMTEQLAEMLSATGQVHAKLLRFPVIWNPAEFEISIAGRVNNPAQGAKSQWAYVDLRDAARAVLLAVERDVPGCELFNIASPTVFASKPTAELVAEWYPGLAARGNVPEGQGACFDWRAAHETLGFVCRYRWSVDGIEELDP